MSHGCHACHCFNGNKMNILDLAQELGLSPKRSASTNNGEFKSKCPRCQAGTDRFCIWPNKGESGRYWCRVCDAAGDGIQFCRDFLGLTFQEACQKLHVTPRLKGITNEIPFKRPKFTPHIAAPVAQSWQQAAKNFIASSHRKLMNQPDMIELLSKRGFTLETIQRFSLGWNGEDLFEERVKWGMPQEMKENGYLKCQWLPKGIVIPSYAGNEPVKLKIRRNDWVQGDSFPKYVEVSGSKQSPSIFGDMSKPVLIVESELDALLVQQNASHLICCIALGGVSKKPDLEVHEWLKQAPLILLSLDFDEAGKKKYSFWMNLYPNLRPWPAAQAKSLGDAIQFFHMDLLKWLKAGLSMN